MPTFITRLDGPSGGVRLAIKDVIDVVDVPTTAGCRAVALHAQPARRDASCLAGARAAGAVVVGKANLHELAFGVTGINPWFGTPTNPLDPTRVPGGSSSGSAVAVATGEADVAYGTDTGGSIRIPSACCGTAGLKTTWGRIPVDGVWPVAPEFDTIGPMARDVAGVVTGMELLEPGFTVAPPTAPAALRVGRIRLPADPDIDAALDALLADVGWEVVDVGEAVVAEWNEATMACGALLVAGAWDSDHELVEAHPDQVGAGVVARLQTATQLRPMLPDARAPPNSDGPIGSEHSLTRSTSWPHPRCRSSRRASKRATSYWWPGARWRSISPGCRRCRFRCPVAGPCRPACSSLVRGTPRIGSWPLG